MYDLLGVWVGAAVRGGGERCWVSLWAAKDVQQAKCTVFSPARQSKVYHLKGFLREGEVSHTRKQA